MSLTIHRAPTATVLSNRYGVVNVKDFGALVDGSTDDSAAWQAAINSGAALVVMPPGTSVIGSQLTPVSNQTIRGAGVGVSTLKYTATSGHHFLGEDIVNWTCRDLTVQGPGITGGGGIWLKLNTRSNVERIVLHNILATETGNAGVSLDTPIVSSLNEVIVTHTGAAGFNVYGGGTSMSLRNCYVSDAATAGFSLIGLSYGSLTACAVDTCGQGYLFENCHGLHAVACGSERNVAKNSLPGDGFVVNGGNAIVLTGAYSSGDAGAALHIQSGTVNGKVWAMGFRQTTVSGVTSTYGIQTDSGAPFLNLFGAEVESANDLTSGTVRQYDTPLGAVTAPAVPASGTAFSNPYGVPMRVAITGGTVTGIAIAGTSTGLTSGMVVVGPGETITLTYSAAPSWVWLGL